MSDFHRGTRRFDDVEAASFSPDDTDLTITEDGGDLVAKDDVGNVVLRYDEGSGSWVMDSLSTDDQTVTETRAYRRSTKTVSSGVIDATDAIWIEMSAESGSSDTLQQMTPDRDEQIVILMSSGDSITVQDASNNNVNDEKFRLDGQADKVLDAIQDRIILQHYPPSNNWHQLSYADY